MNEPAAADTVPARRAETIEKGSLVTYEGIVYRVEVLVNFENIVATEHATGRARALAMAKVALASSENADARMYQQPIEALSEKDWKAAWSRLEAIRPLLEGGDAQHPAHRGHAMTGLVRPHEPEDFPGTEPVSRANQAVALAKMSRSSRSARTSRRSRRNSSSSKLVRPSSRWPSSRSAWRTQLRIAEAEHSNSRANSFAVRPARTSSTIWRRYSGAYAAFVFAIRTPPQNSVRVSTKADQLHMDESDFLFAKAGPGVPSAVRTG